MALSAAADEARRLGYEPWVDDTVLQGETTATARQWLRRIRDRIDQPGACVIAGGETTVTVHGHGRGGRNQEFSLALVEGVADLSVSLLSAGTDGIDGPTDAAGAYVEAHGGKIRVDSRPGCTRFEVRLPIEGPGGSDAVVTLRQAN